MSNLNDLPQDVAQAPAEQVNSAAPALTTVGYRMTLARPEGDPLVILSAQGGTTNESAGVFFAGLVLRDEAEGVIAEMKDELDERGLDIDILSQRLAATGRERDGWMDSAAQMHRDADFYRGLIVRCGQAIGHEAYVCDDGSISGSVLALKVPELVEELVQASRYPKNRILRALRILITGK
jgi:hypothetical protein